MRARTSLCASFSIRDAPSSRCAPSTPFRTLIFMSRGRSIPSAVEFPRQAAGLVALYDGFDAHRRAIQIAFATMFVLIALIMLLSATWLGLSFANRLVAPIRRLIAATDQVSSGNLYVQVAVRPIGGRSRPSRRDLQQDDLGTAPAAEPADRGEQFDRRAAAVHRGGAVGRPGRRRSASAPTARSPSSTPRPSG